MPGVLDDRRCHHLTLREVVGTMEYQFGGSDSDAELYFLFPAISLMQSGVTGRRILSTRVGADPFREFSTYSILNIKLLQFYSSC